jgi:glycosyltransferase involved in cell wall biosynthesis
VLIVAEDGAVGGIGRYCVDLASELGPSAEVACLCDVQCSVADDCWLASQCAVRGVRLHRIGMPAKGWRSGLRGLVGLWRRAGRPVVHVNGRRGNSIALALRIAAPGFRYVTTVHGVLGLHSRRNAIYRLVDLASGRLASTVIAVSEHSRRELIRAGSPPRTTVAIANGLAGPDLKRLRLVAAGRPAAAASGAPLRVGFLGRLNPEKGTVELLEVARRLARSGLRMTIHIAGDGADRNWLVDATKTMTDAGFVEWRGAVADVAGFLGEIDVLVMPSHNEGMPYVVLEGMAAGCSVVAFAVGGIPEVVANEHLGILVRPRDVDGIVAAITRLATDRDLSEAIGRAASSHIEQSFALRTRVPAVRRAYGLDPDLAQSGEDRSSAAPVR